MLAIDIAIVLCKLLHSHIAKLFEIQKSFVIQIKHINLLSTNTINLNFALPQVL